MLHHSLLARAVEFLHETRAFQLLEESIVIKIFRIRRCGFRMVGDGERGADRIVGDIGNFGKQRRKTRVRLRDN